MGIPLKGFAEFSRKVAAEGAVLLKNEGQNLPIKEGESISIFGRTQINYYRSGTGSGGSVNVEYTTNLLEGFRNKNKIIVNEDLASIYEKWIEQNPFDNGGGGWAAEPWHQKEMPLTDTILLEARNKSSKAIVVIGRTAGEDKDNADAATRGIRKGGSNATLKHFACNNQEKSRSQVDAIISERALREIYLKGFEMAVKQGDANSIMTSYNPINGHFSASNYDLNTTVLRTEWGFKGLVMTDWWAKMNDVAIGGPSDTKQTNFMISAQNDVYMVINNYGAEINSGDDNTIESLENCSLKRGELQRSAMNICNFLMHAPVFFRKQEFVEVVDKFEANLSFLPEKVQELSENTKINLIPSASSYIKVRKAGVYRIIANIMSPEGNLSQATCNVTLNNQFVTTIQTSGTYGNWIKQKLVKIELEKGLYELKLDFVKSGMQIDWIEFKQV